jgi:DNA recombination protein RmuC
MSSILLSLILCSTLTSVVVLLAVLSRAAKFANALGTDVRNELRVGREETRNTTKDLRDEVSGAIRFTDEALRRAFAQLQESNERKLEEMRRTVDEKLHETLEKRLGESFKIVSERLDTVHKGLGEMQSLAIGVGDLKRVLTNVKARGTWAEVQLGAILEQILAPEQWARNVCVREGELGRVEYAVRLPGPRNERDACMWLPIDSKFPQEDYVRLQAAADGSDQAAVQAAQDALLRAVRIAAKDIHDKYINPPSTTDYAIMFLATEGLYAEVIRQPAFVEELQNRYRIVVAGPTTLAAILNSLRVGFQTLAIEQRATEVWKVLGAVKTEFGKFATVLAKVQRHLSTASRTIEETGTRTRAMERRLRSVEQVSSLEASKVFELPVLPEEVHGAGADLQAANADIDDMGTPSCSDATWQR